jgi:hypothetical protein
MTICEFAMYRCACQLMSPEELKHAQKLAELVARGQQEAKALLLSIVMDVILNHNGRRNGNG